MKSSRVPRIDTKRAAKLGIAVATLLSLWGSFQYLRFETAYQQLYRDPYKIGAQFSRLADFQSAVPAKAILGYLTDLPPDSIVANAMFDGAEYVLAPRMLQKGTAFDLVLGNFTKPADFGAIGRAHGLHLQHDFGNGVVLFRRESR